MALWHSHSNSHIALQVGTAAAERISQLEIEIPEIVKKGAQPTDPTDPTDPTAPNECP